MDIDKNISMSSSGLRNRAEEQIKVHVESDCPRTGGTTQKLLHELEVHRIELEMQNDELRQARDVAESALEKYTDLYDFAPVGYFTLDHSSAITAVNLRGASLVGIARSRLLGQRFDVLLAHEYRHVFNDFFGMVFKNRDKTTCEVALNDKDHGSLFVQLEAMATISGHECGLAMIDITERRTAEVDLCSYARRLIAIEEELRNKLAVELHDETCRDLTVLGMNMAIIGDGMTGIAPKKLTLRARDSGKLIRGITHNIRNIMVGLRPPMLKDYGLLASLRWHADLF
jgi:PAS domain S-box-containing protein